MFGRSESSEEQQVELVIQDTDTFKCISMLLRY